MTGREKLPNRRMQVTQAVRWGDEEFLLGVGFNRAGQAREVFLHGHKVGSEMEGLMTDACILLSLLLQHGEDPKAIHHTLTRDHPDSDKTASSPIGAAVQRLVAIVPSVDDALNGKDPEPPPGPEAAA